MSGRPSQAVTLAVRLVQRTGCTPAVAALRHGVAPSSVRRAMRRAEMIVQPRGRPRVSVAA